MNNLPYFIKENINLYALNTINDYETLIEFNKICNYEICQYSHEKLRNAKKNYIRMIVKSEIERRDFFEQCVNSHIQEHAEYCEPIAFFYRYFSNIIKYNYKLADVIFTTEDDFGSIDKIICIDRTNNSKIEYMDGCDRGYINFIKFFGKLQNKITLD